ncbi:MAG: long-chain-fatty-acid--CoA ligase [Desulfobacterales bacterium]
MTMQPWPTPFWPPGVRREIDGYDLPLPFLLDNAADRYPDRVYTLFSDAGRTYAQVRNTADRIAAFLHGRGIRKGDPVAIFLPNLPHYPPIFFGVLKAGGVCVTCNPLYTAGELRHQLSDSGATALFCMDHPRFYPVAVEALRGTAVETVVFCNVRSYLPKLKGLIGGLLGKIPKAGRHEPGHVDFDEAVARSEARPPNLDIMPSEDPAVILYTGGTTGVPKGAALTHSNFVFDVMALDEWARLVHEPGKPPERFRRGGFNCYLGVLPWYHSFGLTCAMLSACASGSRLICVPDPRAGDPPFTEVLEIVQKHRPTLMPAVPTIFVAFTNHRDIERYDVSSIMGCFSGGAPLPPEVCRRFEAKTGAVVYEGYGLSETAPAISANPTSVEGRRIGSVGFPLPNTDIKILDVENGLRELPRGEDGEIAASGPQVMREYWNRPEDTRQAMRDIDGRRFFLTGDIGHIDEDGYIIITDRKKDMIIVGGFNVYPREVEDILYTHPKVALVAVVGVPDEKSGERVKAFIQLKPGETATEAEIIEFAKDRMAAYKRPRMVEFRDSIPVSPVGKVLRRVIRDEERRKRM